MGQKMVAQLVELQEQLRVRVHDAAPELTQAALPLGDHRRVHGAAFRQRILATCSRRQPHNPTDS